MKSFVLKTAVVLLAFLAAGCGGSDEEDGTAPGSQVASRSACLESTQPPAFREIKPTVAPEPPDSPGPTLRNFTIDGHPSPFNAAGLVAARRGYFEDVGLAISPQDPVTPVNVIGYVANRGSAFGITHQPQVVAAREKGLPIVAIGSVVPKATMALIWLEDSGIESVADLEGKTIAFTGFSFERDFLRVILEQAGLSLDDVKLERVDYGLASSLAEGDADAIFGGSANTEGAELEAKGLDPVAEPLAAFDIPELEELVVITHPDRLEEEPKMIRAFMSALRRGTQAMIEHPEWAVDAIEAAQKFYEIDGYVPKPTLAEVKAALPLLSRSGHMSPARADHLSGWMCEQGIVEGHLPPTSFLTNSYLATGS